MSAKKEKFVTDGKMMCVHETKGFARKWNDVV
jgi:hypothetical protein